MVDTLPATSVAGCNGWDLLNDGGPAACIFHVHAVPVEVTVINGASRRVTVNGVPWEDVAGTAINNGRTGDHRLTATLYTLPYGQEVQVVVVPDKAGPPWQYMFWTTPDIVKQMIEHCTLVMLICAARRTQLTPA